MRDRIRSRAEHWLLGGRSFKAKAVVGVTCALAALSVRYPMDVFFHLHYYFLIFFPAVVVAALGGGIASACIVIVAGAVYSLMAGWFETGHLAEARTGALLFLASAATTALIAGLLRSMAQRHHDQEILLGEAVRAARDRALDGINVGELTASISHQLRQPLGAITNFANSAQRWLDRNPADIEQAARSLCNLTKSAQEASEILEQMRSFRLIPEGDYKTLALAPLVRRTVDLLFEDQAEPCLPIRIETDLNAVTIYGDEDRLLRALHNILLNASWSLAGVTDEHREIAISWNKNRENVTIEIVDTGRGLLDADPSSVFDPFFTTRTGSMGLGLTISRTIIESHGGRISIEDRVDCHGCIVRVALPHAPAINSARSCERDGPTAAATA